MRAWFWLELAGGLGLVVLATYLFAREGGATVDDILFRAAVVLIGAAICFALLVVSMVRAARCHDRRKLWALLVVVMVALAFLTVLYMCLPQGSEQKRFVYFVWGVAMGSLLAMVSVSVLLLVRRDEVKASDSWQSE